MFTIKEERKFYKKKTIEEKMFILLLRKQTTPNHADEIFNRFLIIMEMFKLNIDLKDVGGLCVCT